MNGTELLTSAGEPIKAISLFGTGSVVLWVVWSFAIAWYSSSEMKDKIMGAIILLVAGALLFYSQVQEKIVLAVVIVVSIIIGVIKILRKK